MFRITIGTFLCATPLLFSCSQEEDAGQKSAGPTPDNVAPQGATPERVAIRHILIAHRDSRSGSTMVGRSRKDAKALASKLHRRLRGGEPMAQLSRQFSNDTTAARGGFLGAAERGAWVPAFEGAAFALKIGEISEIVETKYGFHILQREPLEEVKLAHIVIAHSDSKGIARILEGGKTRSPTEARESAESAHAQLSTGKAFAEVAQTFSDGPMGLRGANLGWFVRGELGPDFDASVFALDVGEVSQIIETIFGFHIVKRIE